jgi:trans-aconitate methyltransferase
MTEWQAKPYIRESGLQQQLAEEQLRALTLAGSERVLDVGCGDGHVTAEIAARLPTGSILGVDPSSDMIAFASKHATQPNLRFEIGDARQLPYRHEFDLVVSLNALHWVPQQDLALRAIHAALKPRGRAVLRFVPLGSRKSLEACIEDIRQLPEWSAHFSAFEKPFIHFTPDQYRALAARSGFEVVTLRVQDNAWDFKTREAFTAFCEATFVEWTRRLPEGEWNSFIAQVLGLYQTIAADTPQELNTFKFYQMEIELTPEST